MVRSSHMRWLIAPNSFHVLLAALFIVHIQLLDVLGERGFTVTLDVVRTHVPVAVEPPSPPAAIVSKIEKAFVFHIQFPKPEIRRNEA